MDILRQLNGPILFPLFLYISHFGLELRKSFDETFQMNFTKRYNNKKYTKCLLNCFVYKKTVLKLQDAALF